MKSLSLVNYPCVYSHAIQISDNGPSLKIFFNPDSKEYVCIDSGLCYVMKEPLLKLLDEYSRRMNSKGTRLKDWYNLLLPELKAKVLTGTTRLTQEDFYKVFVTG